MAQFRALWAPAQALFQMLALGLVAALTVAFCGATVLGFAGLLPWPELKLAWNGAPLAHAGQIAMLTCTALLLCLCALLPGHARVLRLERTHRDFAISMRDITRAYEAVHLADRDGRFGLTGEFENMRARLTFLRDHPDLQALEPELLDLAAQMSLASRELAEKYSDARVAQARKCLEQRQQELQLFHKRLDHANALNSEFKAWSMRLEQDESRAAAKLARLLDELERILPQLDPAPEKLPSNVTVLHSRAD